MDVTIKLNTQKQEFEVKQATVIYNSISFLKHILRWNKIEREIIGEAIYKKFDKIRENNTLLICKKITYLDFISIY